ncbi:hypothetical protein R69658_07950 [Paraburkholderia aspalathi]|uniref:Haemolysin XhlA n=1 Tax=Paraburkholderia aspalathi TaxID=1324617 RepID=A0ABN7NHQ4_9BURK|nr:hypothetical protein [Paraburkholderia aspalathi]MBK3824198.1 hypothetical protein [Paraburkholderia aspalathi]MBK3836038.1 hypothetical protein [Paraburkholderia aspalathi]MBK3865804.1 hypothetical protein [Paraburkholderia aspalathi]CAE6867523.1 hypothetical protein R69658_07950 [Paraburkholderia aspalathi]
MRELFNTETESGKHVTLEIDDDGRLYWNGKLVVTEQRVKLQRWVNAAIIVGAIGALVQGVFAALSFFFK